MDMQTVVIIGAGAIADASVDVYASLAAVPPGADVAVECGGHAAVTQHGEAALAAGYDLLVASVGALADQALHDRLVAATIALAGLSLLRVIRNRTEAIQV